MKPAGRRRRVFYQGLQQGSPGLIQLHKYPTEIKMLVLILTPFPFSGYLMLDWFPKILPTFNLIFDFNRCKTKIGSFFKKSLTYP
jgi:hypothetical protein